MSVNYLRKYLFKERIWKSTANAENVDTPVQGETKNLKHVEWSVRTSAVRDKAPITDLRSVLIIH